MSVDGVRWLDAKTAEVAETRFLVTEEDEQYRNQVSDAERFVLVKEAGYLNRCVDRFTRLAPRNIVEIGIYQGGSAVFWNLVLCPERHLVFDLYDRSVERLRDFAAGDAQHGRLDIRFGVDQSDGDAVAAAVRETFEDEAIDLIIDDASHSYPETRAAFETLFPRLRPGGTYVIEDWGWAHVRDQSWDEKFSRDRPALTNLVVEIMLMCASRTGVVDELLVEPRAVLVTRGPRPLESPFRLADESYNRGMPYRPLL